MSKSEVTHNFAPGDMVEVAEGELIHLQGKIISIDGNKITMLPKHEDLKVSPIVMQKPFWFVTRCTLTSKTIHYIARGSDYSLCDLDI